MSRVQPLDVIIKKPFKNYVHELFQKTFRCKSRILCRWTKWVGEAQEGLMKEKELIKHSFKI